MYVRKLTLHPEHATPMVEHDAASIMLWGGSSLAQTGKLVRKDEGSSMKDNDGRKPGRGRRGVEVKIKASV